MLNNPVQGKRVVVVGGGQTGAEVFRHLISNTDAMPRYLDKKLPQSGDEPGPSLVD
ncbi:hypothetical protein EN871_04320 [bacterium M00.F.Ca.ET.228.01.1.1]|uniref:SidA/IucD/PvdA family monooxygenase n=1 Tax=Paraburkholderia phenoliruptrix TaxID=252970 RepID=UPI001091D19F|nr:SidA/IucD/PvdA family monooxygenase [Paraburkholderia phenoliruptrix]MBW9095916.1 SidA/IucD/PvdA family monooxygenase [Paraburkholderia phenoliruptrix]TGP48027.1 hypothetical protein EN871_04320 [bacterium M00.F.Ca.ET.228.01.1.1]TGS05819.1 hypothetical protein EN834_04320 [bacterium M00.F.Ca.ET.191.01.1.1]TGU10756.1 hypothetical protein EN798_04320 [bacterium M00.F.Ca.ET.155.01.1.1]